MIDDGSSSVSHSTSAYQRCSERKTRTRRKESSGSRGIRAAGCEGKILRANLRANMSTRGAVLVVPGLARRLERAMKVLACGTHRRGELRRPALLLPDA